MRAFSLSLDFELILGWHDLDQALFDEKLREMRDARRRVVELIELLEETGIPATWATVGHLMLERCDGHELGMPDGWLARDPERSADTDPCWYAPDVVQRMLQSSAGFEIAGHGFSHARFDRIPAEAARAELAALRSAAAKWQLEMRSFVFPGNRIGHLSVLADCGFCTYRARRQGPKEAIQPVSATREVSGLVAVPPSVELARLFADGERVALERFRGALHETCERGGVLHAWMHPNEFALGVPASGLRAVLESVAEAAARGELELLTLGALGDRVAPLAD